MEGKLHIVAHKKERYNRCRYRRDKQRNSRRHGKVEHKYFQHKQYTGYWSFEYTRYGTGGTTSQKQYYVFGIESEKATYIATYGATRSGYRGLKSHTSAKRYGKRRCYKTAISIMYGYFAFFARYGIQYIRYAMTYIAFYKHFEEQYCKPYTYKGIYKH